MDKTKKRNLIGGFIGWLDVSLVIKFNVLLADLKAKGYM